MEKNSDNKKGQHHDRDRRDARDRHERGDAHHLESLYTSSDDETKNDDENTYVDDDDASKSTASDNADDDNFALALGMPAQGAKKSEHGSAVAEKEMITARKRKPTR